MNKDKIKCPRNDNDCQPLSQMLEADAEGFLCVGENDGTRRTFKQDRYTWCWKTVHEDKTSSSDTIFHCDERDLIDMVYIMMGALAIVKNEEAWKDKNHGERNRQV